MASLDPDTLAKKTDAAAAILETGLVDERISGLVLATLEGAVLVGRRSICDWTDGQPCSYSLRTPPITRANTSEMWLELEPQLIFV